MCGSWECRPSQLNARARWHASRTLGKHECLCSCQHACAAVGDLLRILGFCPRTESVRPKAWLHPSNTSPNTRSPNVDRAPTDIARSTSIPSRPPTPTTSRASRRRPNSHEQVHVGAANTFGEAQDIARSACVHHSPAHSRPCYCFASTHAHDKSRFATPSWCMLAEPTRLVPPTPRTLRVRAPRSRSRLAYRGRVPFNREAVELSSGRSQRSCTSRTTHRSPCSTPVDRAPTDKAHSTALTPRPPTPTTSRASRRRRGACWRSQHVW
jgi:hypothetical protein